MMFLLYFRRASCHSNIQWESLRVNMTLLEKTTGVTTDSSTSTTTDINSDSTTELPMEILPDIPSVTFSVGKTFAFSLIYLILNILLVAAAFKALSEY